MYLRRDASHRRARLGRQRVWPRVLLDAGYTSASVAQGVASRALHSVSSMRVTPLDWQSYRFRSFLEFKTTQDFQSGGEDLFGALRA